VVNAADQGPDTRGFALIQPAPADTLLIDAKNLLGNQALISSHRKLLSSKATVLNVAEKSEG
jgi:hypothetical protein